MHIDEKWSATLAALLVAMLATAAQAGTADDSPFDIRVTVDRESYGLGEPVTIMSRVCNTSDSSVTVQKSCSGEVLTVEDTSGAQVARFRDYDACAAVILDDTWTAGECRLRQRVWPQALGEFGMDQGGEDAPPGRYRVRLEWRPASRFTEVEHSQSFGLLARAPAAVPVLRPPAFFLLVMLFVAIAWILRWRRSQRSA